jgi:hypothetical protein
MFISFFSCSTPIPTSIAAKSPPAHDNIFNNYYLFLKDTIIFDQLAIQPIKTFLFDGFSFLSVIVPLVPYHPLLTQISFCTLGMKKWLFGKIFQIHKIINDLKILFWYVQSYIHIWYEIIFISFLSNTYQYSFIPLLWIIISSSIPSQL